APGAPRVAAMTSTRALAAAVASEADRHLEVAVVRVRAEVGLLDHPLAEDVAVVRVDGEEVLRCEGEGHVREVADLAPPARGGAAVAEHVLARRAAPGVEEILGRLDTQPVQG